MRNSFSLVIIVSCIQLLILICANDNHVQAKAVNKHHGIVFDEFDVIEDTNQAQHDLINHELKLLSNGSRDKYRVKKVKNKKEKKIRLVMFDLI